MHFAIYATFYLTKIMFDKVNLLIKNMHIMITLLMGWRHEDDFQQIELFMEENKERMQNKVPQHVSICINNVNEQKTKKGTQVWNIFQDGKSDGRVTALDATCLAKLICWFAAIKVTKISVFDRDGVLAGEQFKQMLQGQIKQATGESAATSCTLNGKNQIVVTR